MRLHVKNFILYDILENIDFLRFFNVCICDCVCPCTLVGYTQRPEGNVGASGTSLPGGSELLDMNT